MKEQHAGSYIGELSQKVLKQGRLVSSFLFLLAVDWTMKTRTHAKRNGTQWTLWNNMEDLDCVGTFGTQSHTNAEDSDHKQEFS